MNFRFDSNQIIVFLVAFLIGIGVTSYIRSNNAANIMEGANDEIAGEETINEPVTEDEEVDENADEQPVEEDTAAEPETAPKTTTPAPTPTPATTTKTTKPSTQFVSGTCSTGLNAYKDSKLNAIVLSWSPCASDNFQFYKLVKSSKNSNPTYPATPVAFSSSNKNAATFIDKTIAPRTTYYYRMCVVQRLGQVNCSNVASVTY